MNKRPRRFLNEYDVERALSLENYVDDKIVLANILQKDLDILQNHA